MDLYLMLENAATSTSPSEGSVASQYDWEDFNLAWSCFESSWNCGQNNLPPAQILSRSILPFLSPAALPLDLQQQPWTVPFTQGPASSSGSGISWSIPPSPSTHNLSTLRAPSPSSNQTATQEVAPSVPQSTLQYTCQTCAKIFSNKEEFNRHMPLHTKPIPCPEPSCTLRMAKRRDINRHVWARHSELAQQLGMLPPPRVTCPVVWCKGAKEGFKRPDHLTRHLKRAHGRGPDIQNCR